jgi:hypothetical protein
VSRRAPLGRILLALAAGVLALGAPPAQAAWRLESARAMSVLFNQGIAYDGATRSLFFAGVSSQTNSGLYRTDPGLRRTAAREAAIPRTPERYNHIGDISFDPAGRRLLVPLECYYPGAGGNTCRRGAIGVVDPRTLAFRYVVRLAPAQIAKAMWVEASPDGRWVYTSAGTHLLAYPGAAINRAAPPGLLGRDLGAVLPSSGVSGAATWRLPGAGAHRLFASLNRGGYFQVISYVIRPGAGGGPAVAGPPTLELSVRKSGASGEPEGLAVGPNGRLRWQLVSVTNLTARLLSYAPTG